MSARGTSRATSTARLPPAAPALPVPAQMRLHRPLHTFVTALSHLAHIRPMVGPRPLCEADGGQVACLTSRAMRSPRMRRLGLTTVLGLFLAFFGLTPSASTADPAPAGLTFATDAATTTPAARCSSP